MIPHTGDESLTFGLSLRTLAHFPKIRLTLEIDHIVEPTHRLLLEDVHDAVADLVDTIKTYRSKGRMSQQVMVSTLFKGRQKEAEAVTKAAISRLHVSVHVLPKVEKVQ